MVSAKALLGDGAKLDVPDSAIMMVMVTMFIDTLAGSMSTPVMPYYAKAFNVSTANIGYLYGAWSFSSTVFAPVLTRLADKFGRRPVLILSLVGAGTANLIQGSALSFGEWGFAIFLFGRFFSGIWAAVGATCNVYITDVVPVEIRPQYFAKMSTVPLVAMLFGPGIGGGLSKLGLNVPVVVDGVVTLFSACLVSYYLPETPSFLRSSKEGFRGQTSQDQDVNSTSTPVPSTVYWLGFAQFLGGIGFSTLLSSFGLYFLERYGMDSLRVGFIMMVGSVAMVMTNVWLVPFCKDRMTVPQAIVLGGIINSLSQLAFAFCFSFEASFATFTLIFVGNALRGANSTAFVGSFSDSTNRGQIFAISQAFMNTGRMIGPVMATHLISWYGVGAPFVMACCAGLASAGVTALVERRGHAEKAATTKFTASRQTSAYGEEWEDEVGSPEDVAELGRFMADLLSKRHYKWVSKRGHLQHLMEHVIPELDTSDRDAYYAQVCSIPQGNEGRSICG